MLVPTVSVNALTYESKDDLIIDTKYYEFFKSQFGEDVSYKFFAYDCNYGSYNRTCYYGIDTKNNYVKVDYKTGINSNYIIQITKGVDKNFNVNGVNIIQVKPSVNYLIIYALAFFLVLFVSNMMLFNLFKTRRC